MRSRLLVQAIPFVLLPTVTLAQERTPCCPGDPSSEVSTTSADFVVLRTQEAAVPTRDSESPAWAGFMGGFLAGTATLVWLYAETLNDPDEVSEVGAYAAYAAGTAAGAMITTSIWERPSWTMALGAAIGAAPMLPGLAIEDDSAASVFVMIAWIGAPLGAALGQR